MYAERGHFAKHGVDRHIYSSWNKICWLSAFNTCWWMLGFSLEVEGKKQLLSWFAQPLRMTGFSSSAYSFIPHHSKVSHVWDKSGFVIFSRYEGQKHYSSWATALAYHFGERAGAWPCNLYVSRRCWTASREGPQKWSTDWNTSPKRAGWESWGTSAWRTEGSEVMR